MINLNLETEYPLYEDFESPLWDFFKKEENKDIVGDIIKSWLENKIKLYDMHDSVNIFLESHFIRQAGLSIELKDDGLYVCGLYLVLMRILKTITETLPKGNQYEDVIIDILQGSMKYKYFSKGEKGKYVIDLIKEESENGNYYLMNYLDRLISYYSEEVFDKEEKKQTKALESIYNDLLETKRTISKTDIILINKLFSKKYQLLKFSNKGIKELKQSNLDEKIIEGFKEIRIKRFQEFDITLLIGIITSVYFKKELFLYFDSHFYKFGLGDRNNFIIEENLSYIIVNFTNIIEGLFCKHSLKNNFQKNDLNIKNLEDNAEIIKIMFDQILNQVNKACVDDLYIKLEGRIEDNNRFNEINELIEKGKISFLKYKGKKSGISFEIKNSLKKYKKKIKKL